MPSPSADNSTCHSDITACSSKGMSSQNAYEEFLLFPHLYDDLTKKRFYLFLNEAITTKADKGNTIVIIYREDYNQKIKNFVLENKATEVNNNITTKFQKTSEIY
jgi:hypothetical protein